MSAQVIEPAPELERFRSVVAATLGFRLEDDKLPMLGELLKARVRAAHGAGISSYLTALSGDTAEQYELARQLTVTETYFFRNDAQFDAFRALLQQRTAAVPRRILSAGCSTGEEPYSLAILLAEESPENNSPGVHAIDINTDALRKAREGLYSPWSFRGLPAEFRAMWFQGKGRQFQIDKKVRDKVTFEQRNLLDPAPDFWRPGSFDAFASKGQAR